ncbi:MAG TPA: MATE family efflux transporter, partial [Pseudomonadales bacterium]|nr:MATE family efflux transporter [Pseudomonadales bacterium]
NQGAQSGDVILSANAILMQFVSFSAFFLDGFALAAETLVGSAIGARDKTGLNRSIRFSTELCVSTALLLTFFFWLLGTPMIHLLTNAEAVRSVGTQYLIWAIVTPLLSVWCYLLDGIFIGATRTAEMRNAMIFSLATFLTGWYFLHGTFGNHGLWLAFQLYFLARAASLAFYLPRLR